jgi:hypothetical protein
VRLRRPRRTRAPRRETIRLAVRDPSVARLEHYCHGSGQTRLLGVSFTESERFALAAGTEVVVVLACEQCVWEALVAFRATG